MPLTKTGKKVLREMRGTYGSKKGEEVFYATMNKYGRQWHKSPETFTDTTPLPKRVAGPTYRPDLSGRGSDSKPSDVEEFDKFHGDTPHKNVVIKEKDTSSGKGPLNPSLPDGVDGPFDVKP